MDDADLVITLCSVTSTALHELLSCIVQRSVSGLQYLQGGSLGLVIINNNNNNNNNNWSGVATLQLNNNISQTIQQLIKELSLTVVENASLAPPRELRLLVEYARCGCRMVGGKEMMWLDLRQGQKIRIIADHEHNASGDIIEHKAKKSGEALVGIGRLCQPTPRPRVGVVSQYREDLMGVVVKLDKVEQLVGVWWLQCVAEGTVEYSPVVNTSPKMSSRLGCKICE